MKILPSNCSPPSISVWPLSFATHFNGENDLNQKVVWKPPPIGWLKLNVDASVKGPMDKTSVGGVLQDSNGKWIWGFAASIGQDLVDGAELQALLFGLNRD